MWTLLRSGTPPPIIFEHDKEGLSTVKEEINKKFIFDLSFIVKYETNWDYGIYSTSIVFNAVPLVFSSFLREFTTDFAVSFKFNGL